MDDEGKGLARLRELGGRSGALAAALMGLTTVVACGDDATSSQGWGVADAVDPGEDSQISESPDPEPPVMRPAPQPRPGPMPDLDMGQALDEGMVEGDMGPKVTDLGFRDFSTTPIPVYGVAPDPVPVDDMASPDLGNTADMGGVVVRDLGIVPVPLYGVIPTPIERDMDKD